MSLIDHPAVRAARIARRDAMRKGVRPDWAERLIRVEITHEVKCELRALCDRSEIFALFTAPGPVGPMTIEGFAYYVVDRLPEPGWRVIRIPD